MTSTLGSETIDLARASICRSPPERVEAGWSRRACRPREDRERRLDGLLGPSPVTAGVAVHRQVLGDAEGRERGLADDLAQPHADPLAGREGVTSTPPRLTVPASGRSRPPITFSRVLLPTPLGPSRATISPCSTTKPASNSTWTGP